MAQTFSSWTAFRVYPWGWLFGVIPKFDAGDEVNIEEEIAGETMRTVARCESTSRVESLHQHYATAACCNTGGGALIRHRLPHQACALLDDTLCVVDRLYRGAGHALICT